MCFDMIKAQTKGFTLIELLVVIAIVAILSVVVILALNPAELLRQSRDSNRLSDLGTLRSAISLYLADVTTSSPQLAMNGYATDCYVSTTSTGVAAKCGGRHQGTTKTFTGTNKRAVDGTGWLGSDGTVAKLNFRLISSGAPFSSLPVDPTNDGTYFYSYAADTSALTFQIDAKFESVKYNAAGGYADTDGGSSSTLYEVGTAPGLNL